MGRGVRAVCDIEEDALLFSIPRDLVLQVKNSELANKMSAVGGWGDEGQESDWGRLILTMCWEWGEKGKEGKWKEYFDIMPEEFDTLMFWSDEELGMLKGSMVLEKIGKASSSQLFRDVLLPIVQKHPSIFTRPEYYTEKVFHRMGSLILSRSFHVQESDSSEEDVETEEDDDDDESCEKVEDIGMVPFADILNAKTGCNNARLFYTPTHLEMRSTAPIAAGEQIFNTYASPPNSDLLRRYGHVDYSFSFQDEFPILSFDPEEIQKLIPNENDVVELSASLIPFAGWEGDKEREEKVEWCLEEIGEDSFVLEWDIEEEAKKNLGLPEELWASVWTFCLEETEWRKLKRGDAHLPKTKKLREDERILGIIKDVLENRLKEYECTLEYEYQRLRDHFRTTEARICNRRQLNASVVLLGEQLLLRQRLLEVEKKMHSLAKDATSEGTRKQKGDPLESQRKKKRKV
ncbi:SET domain-containing protein [Atractiella rhizophila]|nr:SET domain-containing protein [Atractiella rhizophila]